MSLHAFDTRVTMLSSQIPRSNLAFMNSCRGRTHASAEKRRTEGRKPVEIRAELENEHGFSLPAFRFCLSRFSKVRELSPRLQFPTPLPQPSAHREERRFVLANWGISEDSVSFGPSTGHRGQAERRKRISRRESRARPCISRKRSCDRSRLGFVRRFARVR